MSELPPDTDLPVVRGGPEDRGDPTVPRSGVRRRLAQVDGRRLATALARRRDWFIRWRIPHPTVQRFAVFVVGSNRSGTQMVCEAIGRSPHGWDYQESESNLVFKDYQLRSDWLIRALIRMSPAPMVSFGNILDSQFTDRLLERFDESRAIWVYRRYQDAANSSVRKWGNHFRDDVVRWVARGEPERVGARGKRIGAETIRVLEETYHEELSAEDGACLYWYMRNRLYFDLRLHLDPRVLLIQYEDAVRNPDEVFGRVFRFLEFPYHPRIITNVHANSVGKHDWAGIDPQVQAACDSLKAQLDERYSLVHNGKPDPNSSDHTPGHGDIDD